MCVCVNMQFKKRHFSRVLLSLLSVLMASSTMQSGLKPCVLDSRPSRDAIFSLTELSVSCESTSASTWVTSVQLSLDLTKRTLSQTCKLCLKPHPVYERSKEPLNKQWIIRTCWRLRPTQSSLPCSSAPTGSGPHPPRSPPPRACVQSAAGTAGHQWSWWPCRGRCVEQQTCWVWTVAASWLELLRG